MKKSLILIAFATAILMGKADAQLITNRTVSVDQIHGGYITHKVWLDNYAMPEVELSNIQFAPISSIPETTIPSSPAKYTVALGVERKRPFALIQIPAYSLDGRQLQRISQLEIQVTEKPNVAVGANNRSAQKTTASNSPLASGTWYKVSIAASGLHKLDYQFLTTELGLSAPIKSSDIRIYGNGGRMLPEDNSIAHPMELKENALWVNDGGDGNIDAGDYVVFYAQGPMGWDADMANSKLVHEKNLYEDVAYYFVNVTPGYGKRIADQANVPTGNVNVSTYNASWVIDNDLYNPSKFGKLWWGEEFSKSPGKESQRSFDFELGTVTSDIQINMLLGNSSGGSDSSYFDVSANSQQLGTVGVKPAYDESPVTLRYASWVMPFTSGKLTMSLNYRPKLTDGSGYLNYIEINARKPLNAGNGTFIFTDINSVGAGNVATYQIAGANNNTTVWDVTDNLNPVRMKGSLNGSTYTFSQDAETLHKFVVMTDAQLPLPSFVSVTPNQNLHGSGQVDYIIVTHPSFKPMAEELANFHRSRSGMKVIVATTGQVYNEFSSGSQDISAIRDFAKMFYDRAGTDTSQMPKYLLLFGDASYDYKDRLASNTNFVPVFESEESESLTSSYSNDDFFGFLDDTEYIENYANPNTLDIGVGRFPCTTPQEAQYLINKIKYYKSPATLGPWRLSTTFVADDADGAGNHTGDAEYMYEVVHDESSIYVSNKVYEDAIPFISTPGGTRAPQANKSINDAIFKGTFLFNYNGHGNTQVLSHERILTQDDYNSWKNLDKMPIMLTATCDFGQFDQPSFVSSGERLILKSDGGVIATVTTTQLVYAAANRVINSDYLKHQFRQENGMWNTFGDGIRKAKNETYSKSASKWDLINFRKFALLGDPALEPNFPEFFIKTESITDGATAIATDTLKALGEYIVSGRVTDVDDNTLTDFSGQLYVTIYDKPRTVNTTKSTAKTKSFEVLNNIIYKGKATVDGGKFSFGFIAPKDINYDYGKGRFSLYAENGQTDAAGSEADYYIGGYSDNPVLENNPPIVKPYIEDSLFRNGGITGPNTLLFAILEDETGINVSGNAVGHDLTAVLDNNISNPYIMNDYYETAANTYKRGYVYFPMTDLEEGRHRLTVKAWDVNNNSGEGHVDFEVINGEVVKVQNLMNYPNPFSDVTHFVFEHNHPDEEMLAEINIYNTSGMIVKRLRQNFMPTSAKSNEITWDGTADNGTRLPSGVYIYRIKISTEDQVETTAYQKLVIVR